jgi:hypothetical protein
VEPFVEEGEESEEMETLLKLPMKNSPLNRVHTWWDCPNKAIASSTPLFYVSFFFFFRAVVLPKQALVLPISKFPKLPDLKLSHSDRLQIEFLKPQKHTHTKTVKQKQNSASFSQAKTNPPKKRKKEKTKPCIRAIPTATRYEKTKFPRKFPTPPKKQKTK